MWLKKTIQQKLQQGLNTSNPHPLSEHVSRACASVMGAAIPAQSPLDAIRRKLSKRQSPSKVHSPMPCCSATSLLLWSHWSCRKDTEILCCECTGGSLHSERAEGWHQNMCLAVDIKTCAPRVMWRGAEEGRAGAEQRGHRRVRLPCLRLGSTGKATEVVSRHLSSPYCLISFRHLKFTSSPRKINSSRRTSDLSFASFWALDAY